jgi:hypothetical protein
MKAAKASNEAQKLAFLSKYEQEIRACPVTNGSALFLRLAAEMRHSGLFSQKTYLVDIAGGIRRRVQSWGWFSLRNETDHYR